MKAVCCPSGDDRLHSSCNAVPLNNIKHYNNGKLNRPWHVPEVRPAGFRIVHSFSGFALAASEEPVSEQQAQAVEGARKINPAAVEVLLDNNRRMTLDFYGDNVFRIFRDDRGGIIRDPKAEPEARILADSPRRPVSRLDVDQQGDAVVITTGKVRIEINKRPLFSR